MVSLAAQINQAPAVSAVTTPTASKVQAQAPAQTAVAVPQDTVTISPKAQSIAASSAAPSIGSNLPARCSVEHLAKLRRRRVRPGAGSATGEPGIVRESNRVKSQRLRKHGRSLPYDRVSGWSEQRSSDTGGKQPHFVLIPSLLLAILFAAMICCGSHDSIAGGPHFYQEHRGTLFIRRISVDCSLHPNHSNRIALRCGACWSLCAPWRIRARAISAIFSTCRFPIIHRG